MISHKLEVCEIKKTLKSSGKNSGAPVINLRLFGTNFNDKNDLYRYAYNTEPKSLEIHRKIMLIEEVATEIKKLKSGKIHLIISGGEPLLQQDSILELLTVLKPYYIEIETNGTLIPIPELEFFVEKFSVNLKLSNAMEGQKGSTTSARLIDGVIKYFVSKETSYFIFDVLCEEDLKEIDEIQRLFKIENTRVYLRPIADSRNNLQNLSVLWKACLNKGYTLSNRFDTGVFSNCLKYT